MSLAFCESSVRFADESIDFESNLFPRNDTKCLTAWWCAPSNRGFERVFRPHADMRRRKEQSPNTCCHPYTAASDLRCETCASPKTRAQFANDRSHRFAHRSLVPTTAGCEDPPMKFAQPEASRGDFDPSEAHEPVRRGE